MQLSDLDIFYQVVRSGSFTQAADRLQCSKAQVSRRVTALEQHLKTKLLNRTTRTLHLTEAGQVCFELSCNVHDAVKAGIDQLDHLNQHPQGKLKISLPPAFGEYALAPLWPKFCRQYPDINLDVQHHTRVVNVIEEGFDVVLRRAHLADSNLIAQPLCTPQQWLVTTPQYIERYGAISQLEDLRTRPCLTYTGQPEHHWHIMDHRLCQEIAVPIHNVFRANSVNVILEMVLAQQGAALLPDFMVKDAIDKGSLVRHLPQIETLSRTVHIVYPSRDYLPPKTQMLITFLKAHFAN